ncbi:MAG: hypothetical protein AAGM67_21550 [Bacteroidota bacterium]
MMHPLFTEYGKITKSISIQHWDLHLVQCAGQMRLQTTVCLIY